LKKVDRAVQRGTDLVLKATEGPATESVGALVRPWEDLFLGVEHWGIVEEGEERGTAYKIVRGKSVGNPAWLLPRTALTASADRIYPACESHTSFLPRVFPVSPLPSGPR